MKINDMTMVCTEETMCDNLDCEAVLRVGGPCVSVTDASSNEHIYCCYQCCEADLGISICE
jgi:hypothetical protein